MSGVLSHGPIMIPRTATSPLVDYQRRRVESPVGTLDIMEWQDRLYF